MSHPQTDHEPSAAYGRDFYEYMDGSASASASIVVPLVAEMTSIDSVVDVGCGTGAWLSAFRRAGASRVRGLDGAGVPLDLLQIGPQEFTAVDHADPPQVDEEFDLAVSLEVAEHLPPAAADTFVEFLTSLAPVVLFSAAIPGQGGAAHVNEQWPAYWSERFQEHGFDAVDVLRTEMWNDGRVAVYYRQNLVLYVDAARSDRLVVPDRLTRMQNPPRPLVHPEIYDFHRGRLERRESTVLSLRAHLRSIPGAARRAVGRRIPGRNGPA